MSEMLSKQKVWRIGEDGTWLRVDEDSEGCYETVQAWYDAKINSIIADMQRRAIGLEGFEEFIRKQGIVFKRAIDLLKAQFDRRFEMAVKP